MKFSNLRILVISLLSVLPAIGLASNSLRITDYNIEAGETKTIYLNLENDVPILGFQAELQLPEGLKAVASNGNYATLTSRASSNFTLTVNASDPTDLRMICYSTTLDEIAAGNGKLVEITVQAESTFTGGDIKLVNVYFTDENIEDLVISDVTVNTNSAEKNSLSADAMELAVGEAVKCEISLQNETSLSAFQLDVVLPENVTVVDGTFEASSRISSHSLQSQALSSGGYRIVVYSLSSKLIEGDAGVLLSFNVMATSNQPASGTIQITNVNFSKADAQAVSVEGISIPFTISNSTTEVIDGLKYELAPDEKEATLIANNYSGDIVVPQTVTSSEITYTVVAVGEDCFSDCTGLTSVTLPDGLTSIGNNAFNGCSQLATVTIESTPTIGTDAFSGCDNLSAVNIPIGSYNSFTGNGIDGNLKETVLKLDGLGYSTICSITDLNFEGTGVTAYTAKINNTENYVTLTETTQAAAGEGYVVSGTAGTYVIPATSGLTLPESNDLIGISSKKTQPSISPTDNCYALRSYDGSTVAFAKIISTLTFPYGKAYIQLSGTSAANKLGVNFGTATGIQSITAEDETESAFYNLSGVRVQNPTKGLYIRDGKKVLVK